MAQASSTKIQYYYFNKDYNLVEYHSFSGRSRLAVQSTAVNSWMLKVSRQAVIEGYYKCGYIRDISGCQMGISLRGLGPEHMVRNLNMIWHFERRVLRSSLIFHSVKVRTRVYGFRRLKIGRWILVSLTHTMSTHLPITYLINDWEEVLVLDLEQYQTSI